MRRMMSHLILLMFGGLLLAACGAAPKQLDVVQTIDPPRTGVQATDPPPTGVQVIDPPRPVSDIMLITQEGNPLQMSDLNGHHVLVAFGYTHCPDVCPVTLAHFKRIKALLGESAAAVDFVFVSVDGRRDTPQVLQQYLAYFRENFIGLTGDENSVREFATSYGAQFTLNDAGGFAENYTVDHTAGAFLLNRDGQLMRFYGYSVEPEVIATDIEGLLRG